MNGGIFYLSAGAIITINNCIFEKNYGFIF